MPGSSADEINGAAQLIADRLGATEPGHIALIWRSVRALGPGDALGLLDEALAAAAPGRPALEAYLELARGRMR